MSPIKLLCLTNQWKIIYNQFEENITAAVIYCQLFFRRVYIYKNHIKPCTYCHQLSMHILEYNRGNNVRNTVRYYEMVIPPNQKWWNSTGYNKLGLNEASHPTRYILISVLFLKSDRTSTKIVSLGSNEYIHGWMFFFCNFVWFFMEIKMNC